MSRLICWLYRIIFGLEVRMVSDLEALEAERENLQAVHDTIEERLRIAYLKIRRQRGTNAARLDELEAEAAYLLSRRDELYDALRTKREQIDNLLKARADQAEAPKFERRGGLVPKGNEGGVA